jgi:hypothetical protein
VLAIFSWAAEPGNVNRRRLVINIFGSSCRHRAQRSEGRVRQRPLQCCCLTPWCAHPYVAFLRRGQDHRHRLGMNGSENAIGVGCEKGVDVGLALGGGLRFGTAFAFSFGPETGEAEHGTLGQKCEPHDVLLARGRIGFWRVFRKARRRHKATIVARGEGSNSARFAFQERPAASHLHQCWILTLRMFVW